MVVVPWTEDWSTRFDYVYKTNECKRLPKPIQKEQGMGRTIKQTSAKDLQRLPKRTWENRKSQQTNRCKRSSKVPKINRKRQKVPRWVMGRINMYNFENIFFG